MKLRDKLFLSYASLSAAILLAAAWVIDVQVVTEARHQVRDEMKNSLPLYEAVWEEQSGRLSALGMAMAGSPIVKTIFGDPRASRDAETIRQMLADFGQQLSGDVDLVVIADGAGRTIFLEDRGPGRIVLRELPSARMVAETQKPAESFEVIDGRFFHLALAPVVSHSGSTEVNNTLVVLVAGSELGRPMAEELKRRAHSDVVFFAGNKLYSSSLSPEAEEAAAGILPGGATPAVQAEPAEIAIGGEKHLAFARPLSSLDSRVSGRVVVLHSLGAASQLFHAISVRLALVGTLSVVLVLLISYDIARRITRPLESLALGVREFGDGHYEHRIDVSAGGEIGQLALAFEQMRRSIRQGQAVLVRNERLAAIGRMASGIIHDLRSPLAAISTAAELFAKSELSPDKRHVLAVSQVRASRRMEDMLRELLEYARGKYALKTGSHRVASLVDDAIHDTVGAALHRNVKVNLQVPEGIFACVDSERVRRLLVNLLVNSLQAMPDGGTITVRADAEGARVRLYIADTGTGIPAELRDRLFEPFATHGKEGGTGLGLAVASGIAEAHGGRLTLVSAVGEPTEFCLELPLAAEERQDAQDSAGRG